MKTTISPPNLGFPSPESISHAIAKILEPYSTGRRSAHTVRHLAQKLAENGGREHLRTHDEPAQINEKAFAAALLDHKMPGGLAAVYGDLNYEVERLAGIAACMITEYVTGDLGADHGLDEERILSARRNLQEKRAAVNQAQLKLETVHRQLETICDRHHPLQSRIAMLRERKRSLRAPALDEHTLLSDREYRRLQHQVDEADDELDEARDELTTVQGQLAADLHDEARFVNEASEQVHRAEKALHEAIEARVPLRPDQEPGDLDRRLEELLDGTERRTDSDGAESRNPVLLRRWLSIKEYAQVIGMPHTTLRRQIRVSLAGDGYPFAGGATNTRNPWCQPIKTILESFGPRTRRFNFDALDLSYYTPGQIRAMREILASLPPGQRNSNRSDNDPENPLDGDRKA